MFKNKDWSLGQDVIGRPNWKRVTMGAFKGVEEVTRVHLEERKER